MRYSNVAMFALIFVAAPSVHGHLNDTSVNRELKAETKLRRGPPVDPLDGGPRFRKGEIIVKGSPLDLPPGVKVIRYLKKSNLTVIKVTRGREKAIVEKLKKKKVMAEPNFEVFASAVTPNDSYLNYQWHFDKVQARDAWEHTTGQGIIVAVLDTGLALTGNDGIGCVRTDLQRNTHDDNFNVHDGDGHGTHGKKVYRLINPFRADCPLTFIHVVSHWYYCSKNKQWNRSGWPCVWRLHHASQSTWGRWLRHYC
jgi:hypothetical protein